MKTTTDTISKAVIIVSPFLYFFKEVDAFEEQPEA
ncbi:hypothetical protein EV199_4151 [Pseudobacter ginsenosidimutans]|uniref:Uncharacterized protein n=1 Tax=Pseudobacter ginsenosidimutans TaxID=661488 RepID=A0A4Q7MTQ7_9BACT|nr:hypothetical protein EV199_4151 [Pseudobacter ginsenosidimutans]